MKKKYYTNEKYLKRRYCLDAKILCPCGEELLKSNIKGYDYFCPKCGKYYFKEDLEKPVKSV